MEHGYIIMSYTPLAEGFGVRARKAERVGNPDDGWMICEAHAMVLRARVVLGSPQPPTLALAYWYPLGGDRYELRFTEVIEVVSFYKRAKDGN